MGDSVSLVDPLLRKHKTTRKQYNTKYNDLKQNEKAILNKQNTRKIMRNDDAVQETSFIRTGVPCHFIILLYSYCSISPPEPRFYWPAPRIYRLWKHRFFLTSDWLVNKLP